LFLSFKPARPQPRLQSRHQLTLALEQDFRVKLDDVDIGSQRAFIIDRDQPHLVEGQAGWVATFLINPESAVAAVVQRELLQGLPG
jgi:hypothetical protein